MTAAVIRAILSGNAPLLAFVPASRIVSGLLPQGTAAPALSIEEVSNVPQPTIDAQAYNLMRSRVQVTVVASSYVQQKAVAELVRVACEYQRGTIAGRRVASIVLENSGPDMRDANAQLYTQPLDFLVVHQQAT